MAAPLLRTIHHLAASGGTMMSRAIAANQDVYLLSELHPIVPRSVDFNPMDPLQQAVAQYQSSLHFTGQELAEAFLLRLQPVVRKVEAQGGHLVIREHSQTDWLVGPTRPKSNLLNVLKPHYPLRSIVTLRNPVETYLSLVAQGWHYKRSFDEFCAVVRQFLAYFAEAPVFHYEDFVQSPDAVLQRMLAALELPFDPAWRQRYGDLRLTGDSGRGGAKAAIQPMPMRPVDATLRQEILNAENYHALCETFGYYRDPEDQRHAREQLLTTAT